METTCTKYSMQNNAIEINDSEQWLIVAIGFEWNLNC